VPDHADPARDGRECVDRAARGASVGCSAVACGRQLSNQSAEASYASASAEPLTRLQFGAMTQRRVAGRMKPQPRSGPGAGKPGRSDSIRSASIGAVAGSVVAALIAGGVGLATADRQITAEDRRSQVDFLRSKQQEAYAQFLTAETGEFRLRGIYVTAFGEMERSAGDEDKKRKATNAFDQLSDAHDKLTQALGNVVLVGSLRAAIHAQDVEQQHSVLVVGDTDNDGVIDQRELLENPSSDGGSSGNVASRVADENEKIQIARSQFILRARSDLGY
jgi:hypothetical protein